MHATHALPCLTECLLAIVYRCEPKLALCRDAGCDGSDGDAAASRQAGRMTAGCMTMAWSGMAMAVHFVLSGACTYAYLCSAGALRCGI